MKKNPVRIGLLVREEKSDGYFHLKASPVVIGLTRWEMKTIDEGHPAPSDVKSTTVRNPRSEDWRDYGDIDLDDLLVNSQGNDADEARRLYGFDVEYRGVFSVNRSRATRMAKSLTTIEKRMAKLDDKYGYVGNDFGQYLLRVAAAIGAETIVTIRPNTAKHLSYDETKFQFHDLRGGASVVNHRIAEWAERRETEKV